MENFTFQLIHSVLKMSKFTKAILVFILISGENSYETKECESAGEILSNFRLWTFAGKWIEIKRIPENKTSINTTALEVINVNITEIIHKKSLNSSIDAIVCLRNVWNITLKSFLHQRVYFFNASYFYHALNYQPKNHSAALLYSETKVFSKKLLLTIADALTCKD